MTLLSSFTQFTIQDAEYLEESYDLVLLPENAGTDALRELHYPGDVLPPLIYEQMPDWSNFDTGPLTARPLSKTEMTLTGNKTARWRGQVRDNPVKELWRGTDKESRMTLYFFRRLAEYFFNPPSSGYITWHPKDRTTKAYNIEIESLTVGGEALSLDYLALYNEVVTKEIVLQFRIIGEAA